MMTKGLISLNAKDCDESRLARIAACICQAEYGDQTNNMHQNLLYSEVKRKKNLKKWSMIV